MRAEVYWELGEFDRGLAILSSPMKAHLEAAVTLDAGNLLADARLQVGLFMRLP